MDWELPPVQVGCISIYLYIYLSNLLYCSLNLSRVYALVFGGKLKVYIYFANLYTLINLSFINPLYLACRRRYPQFSTEKEQKVGP